jgi:tripartite ATP-independent transporter DctP family solute receptor
MAPWNSLVPLTLIPSLPYLFRSPEHARSVMAGSIGDEIAAGFGEHGVEVLAFYDGGARSFYNSKRQINSPADMAGLKLRVIQSDVFVDMVGALGASATPMPYGEVFSAIQTGVVDGAENNFPSYDTANHYQVAKYYSLDEHTIVPEVFVMSKSSWDKLTPEDQAIFKQAARESAEKQWELWDAFVLQSRAKVEGAGTEIASPEKQPFIDAMKPVYDKYVNTPELQDLVARIQAVQ